MSTPRERRSITWVATGSIVGLLLGLLVGSVADWVALPGLTQSIAGMDVVSTLWGVPLSATLVAFVIGIVILSFASVGIPNGGGLMRAAPFYVAAGVPMEGYLLTEAVESIPDIFKTVMNVTGDMAAATIVNRLSAERTADAAEAPGAGIVGLSDSA